MYSHQLSIPRPLARPHREVAELREPGPRFFRGLLYGVAFSAPIWALIIWGVKELFW